MTWEDTMAHYSDADKESLTRAAMLQADRIEEAARDPLCDGWVNDIDMRELWPFVQKRREEIAKERKPAEAPKPEPVSEAPVEPVAAPKPPPARKLAPKPPHQRRSTGKK